MSGGNVYTYTTAEGYRFDIDDDPSCMWIGAYRLPALEQAGYAKIPFDQIDNMIKALEHIKRRWVEGQ